MSIFGYAIDLAESLNYCAITVLDIGNKARLRDIRKFKNVSYPMVKRLLLNDMFPSMPPTYVATDYTSEKSFSEELEATMNPSFVNPNSSGYNRWRYVEPYKFTSEFKMTMKQNTRTFLENRWFQEPNSFSSPEKEALWIECKEQLLRETIEPKAGGGFKVPKPVGQDNDLAMSLEMNLMKAKDYLTDYGDQGEQVPLIASFDVSDEIEIQTTSKNDRIRDLIRNIMNDKSIGTDIKSVRVKMPDDSDFF